ncbi:MAG: nuclear transport factor 2 family protein [Actinomycetota bacterium]|nr:nuclear transport factor 2 family protein [Actinomycetota bacterium]
MSGENLELVREMYVAFHGGDAERALSYFASDVVVDPGGRVDSGVGYGRDALARIIGEWVGAFDDWSEEIEDLRAVGDEVHAVAVQSGRERATGIETRMRYAVGYRVEDGVITRMTLYRDPADVPS